MRHRYGLTVFDLDGTLIDSREHILTNSRGAFAACGLPPPGTEALLAQVGLPLADCLAAGYRAATGVDPGAGEVARLRQAYLAGSRAEGTRGISLFPGVGDLLDRLAAAGARLAIATSKGRPGTTTILESFGLADRFTWVLCHGEGWPDKPDPAMLTHLVRRSGLPPTEVVMVGDTSFDLAMGRAAGVRTCGVGWGHHRPDRLAAEHPTHLVGDVAELVGVLLTG